MSHAPPPLPVRRPVTRSLAFRFMLLFMPWLMADALTVHIEPRFGGQPMRYDTVTLVTSAGQTVSVTRLDFILSGFAVRAADTWIELTNEVAFISARDGRLSFTLDAPTFDSKSRLRFHVGLPPAINHADPALYPADHPLNPLVNQLHWGWMGGYVFLALEGHWKKHDGSLGGFSYHVATDALLMTTEVAFTNSDRLVVEFSVDHLLAGIITDDQSATHSRASDTLASTLATRIEQAFQSAHAPMNLLNATHADHTSKTLMAPDAKPYRFSFSRFFPRPALPEDNPLTEEGVALGKELFFDTRLSFNGSQSCASCHQPEFAFADPRAVSIGAEGHTGQRNAMSLHHLAWKSSFRWDGLATSLRQQALEPIQNPHEMHESLSNVVTKLDTPADHARFAMAFGDATIDADRIARALEQFLLVQVSCDSKFDRVLTSREDFTEAEQRGFELFHTEFDPAHGQFGADCFHCHGGPLLQSQTFANNGLTPRGSDTGRFAATGKPGDLHKFAVPSLRNVALTAPYMHDGRFATLEDVVSHYSTGVVASVTLDPNLAKHPPGGVPLSPENIHDLVAFLKTLTGDSAMNGSGAMP